MGQKKSYLLRIDPGLWNELQAWASVELRSVNSQIEYLLWQAVRARRGGRGRPTEPGPDGENGKPDGA
jgi:hypothetical protein